MAWTKAEQSRPANTGIVVLSEVTAGFDKTLTVTSDLGAFWVIRPRFIEIFYTAFAAAGIRALEMRMARGGVDVYTMVHDQDTHPDNAEVIRIHLVPELSVIEASVQGATDNHEHTMAPIILGQGDSLRILATANGNGGDAMHLFVHADILSKPQE